MNLIQLANGDWCDPMKIKSCWSDQYANRDGKYEAGVDFNRGGLVQEFVTQSEAIRFRDDCAARINQALRNHYGPMLPEQVIGEYKDHLNIKVA